MRATRSNPQCAMSIQTLHASAHHGATCPHRCEPRGATLSAIVPGGLRGAAPTPLLNRSLERLLVLLLAPARRTSRLAGVVGPVGAHVILNTGETAKSKGVNVTEGPYVSTLRATRPLERSIEPGGGRHSKRWNPSAMRSGLQVRCVRCTEGVFHPGALVAGGARPRTQRASRQARLFPPCPH